MNRRTVLGASTLSIVPQVWSSNATAAQDDVETRLTDLEDRVEALEKKIRELTGDNKNEEENNSTRPDAQTLSAGGTTISGTGTTLANPLKLDEGLYRLDLVLNVENGFGDTFVLSVAGSEDFEDQMIFFEFFEGSGEFEASTSWEADEDGEYSFQIDCMSEWTITFSAMN